MSSKKIAILYGSATGNAQDFATILSHKLRRLHFAHTLCSLGDYTASDILHCRYMFIICSTTGQGELPRNVHETSTGGSQVSTLWNFLKKRNLPADFLNHLNVSLLGLGDSSYPKFNYGIRKLHERFVNQLGAVELFGRLEADEISMAGSNKDSGSGTESVYFEYEKRIIELMKVKFPYRKFNGETVKRTQLSDEVYLEPITFLSVIDESKKDIKLQGTSFYGNISIHVGRIIENERITHKSHFQDVRKFTFEQEIDKPYYPGDTIAIYPCNIDLDVQLIFEAQPHWLEVADEPLEFTNGAPSEIQNSIPVQDLTLRNILKYYCDFMSIPRASFFMKVWVFATDLTKMERGQEQLDQQKEKLHQFGTDKDMQDLYDYCNRPRRSILEVIEDFPSLKLPWEFILDYMPVIKPRFYSISSGASESEIELTIAIVKYKTILKKIRRGLCTNYISRLKKDDQIYYRLFNNHLLSKSRYKEPFILISPGVGLAPMLSFIKSNVSDNNHLIFGNRVKDSDYLYREFLENLEKEGNISLQTCFSRDRENSPDVKYVQDVLWKYGEQMSDLIVNEHANIYLCGSSGKMPIQVRLTIVEILKKWGHFKDDLTAQNYLKDMEKNNRYLQETW